MLHQKIAKQTGFLGLPPTPTPEGGGSESTTQNFLEGVKTLLVTPMPYQWSIPFVYLEELG